MKNKKNLFQKRQEQLDNLKVQVRAMKRVLWGILEQEGGTYKILPNNFEKAHTINAGFDAKINEDGSFSMFQTEYTDSVSGIEREIFENGETNG